MALDEMEGRVDAIMEGPDCSVGIESTVVDIRDPRRLTILRPGRITSEELRGYCGRNITTATDEVHRSPGTRYRHYRPNAPIFLVPPFCWNDAVNEAARHFSRVFSRRSEDFSDLAGYTAALYRTFWEAERDGAECILMESVDTDKAPGLNDRLQRAAEGVYHPGLIAEWLRQQAPVRPRHGAPPE
jgi:L-threonylcarbamoyladenylate synthase